MRYRTAVTIGHRQPEPAGNLNLESGIGLLNDDCLLLICEQLSLGDQLRLMQLQEERLSHLVLRLWSGKYSEEFDWSRDGQLLRPDEQSQLLELLGSRTRALLNFQGTSEGCRKWLKQRQRRKSLLPCLQRLSFCQSDSLVIQTVALMSRNLVELRLGEGEDLAIRDLEVLFGELQKLRVFELRSMEKCQKQEEFNQRNFPPNLETLNLPACLLNSCLSEIFQLSRLRHLTGFLCRRSGHLDSDLDDKANARNSGTGTLNACLRELHAARRHCHIVGLRLQCRLDDSLPSTATSTCMDVLRLRHFAWHSQLTVHYDVADGSIRWRPQRPQAVLSLLPFIASQAESLRELDFTRNAHATPTFLAQVGAHLRRSNGCHRVSVWHDAGESLTHSPSLSHSPASFHSHSTKMTDTDTAETNDLAFVELELLHLPNEQTEVEVGTGEMTMPMRDYHLPARDDDDNGWREREIEIADDSGSGLVN